MSVTINTGTIDLEMGVVEILELSILLILYVIRYLENIVKVVVREQSAASPVGGKE